MRMVDADALKKNLSENYTFYGFRQLLNDFYEALDSAPSIDIVRCGECIHWKRHPHSKEYGVCSKVSYGEFEVVMDADDFCSYGEREGE